jgi:hypothetical protein
LLWPLLAPVPAGALVVEIQGTRLEIQLAGSSCVEIAGSYPGMRIEASEAGKAPRICYNSNKVNSITVLDAIFVATAPVKKDIVVKFEHDFPPGINGKIMARARLRGFFSAAEGVGVPTGDKLGFSGFFSQNGHDDVIAEPLDLAVDDNLDSAVFDYSTKEQYLVSGGRVLKGVLTFSFDKPGHRLTLEEKSGVSLDTGSTMADKLELMEPEPAEGGDTQATPPAEGKKPALPPELSPEPAPPQKKSPATEPRKSKGKNKDAAAAPAKEEKKAEPPQGQKPVSPAEPAPAPAGETPFTTLP